MPAVTSDGESAVARTNSTLSADSTQRLEINSDASLDIEFDVPASITPDVERALQVSTTCCLTRPFHQAELADAGLALMLCALVGGSLHSTSVRGGVGIARGRK